MNKYYIQTLIHDDWVRQEDRETAEMMRHILGSTDNAFKANIF